MSYRVKFHKAIKQPSITNGTNPKWGDIKGDISNQKDLNDVIVKVNENASQIALIKQIKQEIKDIANSSTDFNDFKGKLGNG